MVQIVGERAQPGDAIVDYESKMFDDIQANEGEKAYIFMHTVPFEGSVGLVNMLTATRIGRKGFDTSIVLFGPGSLMASASRGFPTVGDEAFPGALGYNKQLQTFMNVPRDPLPFPSILVASTNDVFVSVERAVDMATAWGSELHFAGEAGHINVESGHGPWPEGLLMFTRLMQRLRA